MGMSEAQCLSTFDAMRTPIYAAAKKVYAKYKRNMNILTASDLGWATAPDPLSPGLPMRQSSSMAKLWNDTRADVRACAIKSQCLIDLG